MQRRLRYNSQSALLDTSQLPRDLYDLVMGLTEDDGARPLGHAEGQRVGRRPQARSVAAEDQSLGRRRFSIRVGSDRMRQPARSSPTTRCTCNQPEGDPDGQGRLQSTSGSSENGLVSEHGAVTVMKAAPKTPTTPLADALEPRARRRALRSRRPDPLQVAVVLSRRVSGTLLQQIVNDPAAPPGVPRTAAGQARLVLDEVGGRRTASSTCRPSACRRLEKNTEPLRRQSRGRPLQAQPRRAVPVAGRRRQVDGHAYRPRRAHRTGLRRRGGRPALDRHHRGLLRRARRDLRQGARPLVPARARRARRRPLRSCASPGASSRTARGKPVPQPRQGLPASMADTVIEDIHHPQTREKLRQQVVAAGERRCDVSEMFEHRHGRGRARRRRARLQGGEGGVRPPRRDGRRPRRT